MDKQVKLSDKFFEVIKCEGVVSIVSWGSEEPHVANTWNSYLVVTEDERILIPAYGLRKTQQNVAVNNRVKLALGTREVLDSGSEYDMMKEKFSFLSRVLEVTVTASKQTL